MTPVDITALTSLAIAAILAIGKYDYKKSKA